MRRIILSERSESKDAQDETRGLVPELFILQQRLLLLKGKIFMMKKGVKKFAASFFFALGVLLLILLIRKFGWGELFSTFRNLGWNLAYVMTVPLFWYVSQTLGWYFVLEETGQHVRLGQLLKIKLGGEAVNTLTPVSFVGGDPVRILLLTKTMPGTLSTASVVLDRTMQSLAVIVLLAVGMLAAWLDLELPAVWKATFPATTLALFGLIWFFIHRQKKGIFEFLSNFLSKLGIKKHRGENFQRHIEAVDQRISAFYRHNPRRFAAVLFFHVAGRLAGVLEIYLVAWLMAIPLSLLGALYLATLTVLVNVIFVFIPGSMGVMEGAYGALLLLLNLNPIEGVAIQLIRRLRSLFWIFIGLFVMLTYHKRKR